MYLLCCTAALIAKNKLALEETDTFRPNSPSEDRKVGGLALHPAHPPTRNLAALLARCLHRAPEYFQQAGGAGRNDKKRGYFCAKGSIDRLTLCRSGSRAGIHMERTNAECVLQGCRDSRQPVMSYGRWKRKELK